MLRRSNTADSVRTSLSATKISPRSGSTSRLKQRSSVVFPEPLSPTRAVVRPAGTSRLTSSRATTFPKRCDTFRALIAVGMHLRVHAPSHCVDDCEINECEAHEHQLRHSQQLVYSKPYYQLIDHHEEYGA